MHWHIKEFVLNNWIETGYVHSVWLATCNCNWSSQTMTFYIKTFVLYSDEGGFQYYLFSVEKEVETWDEWRRFLAAVAAGRTRLLKWLAGINLVLYLPSTAIELLFYVFLSQTQLCSSKGLNKTGNLKGKTLQVNVFMGWIKRFLVGEARRISFGAIGDATIFIFNLGARNFQLWQVMFRDQTSWCGPLYKNQYGRCSATFQLPV